MILLVLALATTKPPIIVGVGNSTCEVAFSDENYKRTFDYVLGAWTGMNIASNKPVGHSGNRKQILEWVITACADHPALPLADAVLGIHMRFERLGR